MASEHSTRTNTSRLSCSEINSQSGNPAILLIHGAFVSSTEWDLVTPYLANNYHLLLPDLPGHGGSKDITPFSKELAAKLLADLISERTLDGRAHVVSFSLGAHVAIELASKYPDCVNSVFVSGYEVYDVAPQTLAAGMKVNDRLSTMMPRRLAKWLMDGTDVATSPFPPSQSLRLAVAETVCIKDGEWPSPWKARTLVVAAGKAGLLPTADHPHDAVRLRDIGRKGNEETKAATHPKMRHPWNRQAPELFANAVRKWFEEGLVTDGFVEL
jgi:pimeloyl-ACP methyl ester carboxylesterase